MIYLGPFHLGHGICPYLPDRQWASVSLHVERIAPVEVQGLLEAGFRRSGRDFYRPACPDCQECVSLRLPVARFRPGRTQRRVWRRNQDLEVVQAAPGYTEEKLDLYRRFLAWRFDREDTPGIQDFHGFLGPGPDLTVEMDYRLKGRLVAFGILDATPQAASSVYFVHDPEEADRRLGTFSVLQEVRWCRETGRNHLYLGLWVRQCRAMDYKARFHPHELLRPQEGWCPEGQDPSPDAASREGG